MAPHVFVKTLKIPKWEPPKSVYFRGSFSDEEKISITDDFVLNNMMQIFKVPEVYDASFKERRFGMDYHGRSILDTNASQTLVNELNKNCDASKERDRLISFLLEAIKDEMYVIHFGV